MSLSNFSSLKDQDKKLVEKLTAALHAGRITDDVAAVLHDTITDAAAESSLSPRGAMGKNGSKEPHKSIDALHNYVDQAFGSTVLEQALSESSTNTFAVACGLLKENLLAVMCVLLSALLVAVLLK